MTRQPGHILDLIAAVYEAEQAPCDGMLAAAAIQLRTLAANDPITETPTRLAVTAELPWLVGQAQSSPFHAVAQALGDLEPRLRWRQNPNYTTATAGPAFLNSYGYVELAGRGGPWPSERIAVGFLVLGANTHYPPHHHPAREVYHVVSGSAEWWRNGEAWHTRPPGAAIYHAPNIVHATRTGPEPLLALYCWTGNIDVAAELI